MRNRLAPVLTLVCAGVLLAQPNLLPRKPATLPEFRVPQDHSRDLDEPWIYVQTLYDAAPTVPEEFGAIPVGFASIHQGRSFIATMHTFFRSTDGGRTWTNMDPQPAPQPSPGFEDLRPPNFISGLTAKPVVRTDPIYDSLYYSLYSSETLDGAVRLIRGFGSQHVLWSDTLFQAPIWLTSVIAPDSQSALALAGFDARIYRNDSVTVSEEWDTLSHHFGGTWVSEHATVGDVIIAVGSHHWRSADRGATWEQRAAADPAGDADIAFSPSGLRGIACGGRSSPAIGWARATADTGQTWTARQLITTIPLRTAVMVNDTLGYVAGGLAEQALGGVWRTTDGGLTWSPDLSVDAEITELGVARESNAYVNVIAAGFYADFRGGVWRSRIFAPDTSGAVLVADRDTLRMYAPVGATDVTELVISNLGNQNVLVADITTSGPFFNNCCEFEILLETNESMTVTVTFQPTEDGTFEVPLRVLNDQGQFLEILAIGETSTPADERGVAQPTELGLAVYPNPGNAVFRLNYALARQSEVTLTIFDVTGREVATLAKGPRATGEHVVTWNAGAEASGVYFAVLHAGNARQVEKLVLMK